MKRILALSALVAVVLCGFAQPVRATVTAEAWGYNYFGTLGDGTNTSSDVPVAVSNLSGITAVAGGGYHSLSLYNGGVFDWGRGLEGELGNNASGSSVPVAVSTNGSINLSSGVTAIAGGFFHSMALQNGGVFAWGYNADGELGNKSTTNSSVPVAVSTNGSINLSSGVTAIAGGFYHSLALQNGGVFAWGNNGNGELGNNSTTNSLTPVAVSINGSINLSSGVTAIAGGGNQSLALQNGGVFAWGYNVQGELGDGTTTGSSVPVAVSTNGSVNLSSGVTAIAGGQYHSLALQNGNVFAWGQNGQGELGDGTTINHDTPEQIDPTDVNHIIAIAANSAGESSYALSADGSIWDWGLNADGELGLGNNSADYLTPQHLLPPTGYVFTSIAANAEGALATLAPIAVPEPASLSLLALGSLTLLRRRRLLDRQRAVCQ